MCCRIFKLLTVVPAVGLTGLALSSSAVAQAPDWVANAPDAGNQQADGLLLRHHERIELDDQGKVTIKRDRALKMYTGHLTRGGYFDPEIDWNNARYTMEVDKARTWMADGTEVTAQANSLVPNTAEELQWAVPYAHMRQMTISLVGVEHGAASQVAYTIADREPTGVPLWGVVALDGFLPVANQEIAVAVPKGVELKHGTVFCELDSDVVTKSGVSTTTFVRTDVALANTAELLGNKQGLCRLGYSTASDWDEVVDFLLEGLDLSGDASVGAKVVEVVGEATLPAEQLALAHDFVISGIRTVHWPLSAFDFRARPAHEVLQSSVGHSLDKAVLLTAMLRYLGFEADLALVSGEREIAPAVPSPTWFDQAWVRVELTDGALWLDPTVARQSHNRFDLGGHPTLLLVKGEEPRTLGDMAAADNAASLRVEATISEEDGELQVSGRVHADYAYGTNPLVGFDRSADGVRQLAGQLVMGGALVGEVVVGHRADELLAFGASFSGGKLPRTHGLPTAIVLPRLPGLASSSALQSHRQKRTLPLVLPDGALTSAVVVKLTLPAGWEPLVLPRELELENKVGHVVRTVVRDGAQLSIHTELVLHKPVVEPDLWPYLRALLIAADGDLARTILLNGNFTVNSGASGLGRPRF
ncbi:MAG: DUF3858 domain-containing protein [Proteobacteria bacterium]|nr:DUF3858 domain-containing protein [Pseudomonadota bacterium]